MTELTAEKKRQFLGVLAAGNSVASAARAIQVSRQNMYLVRKADPDFAAAWDDAVEEGTDFLEDEAVSRAKSSSDLLLIFLLKARRSEKFRESRDVNVGGQKGGEPVRQKIELSWQTDPPDPPAPDPEPADG